jgi:hypothetical protein
MVPATKALAGIVHAVSPNENPVPVTVTGIPVGPVLGERVILGVVVEVVTVKVALAESPDGFPVKVTV